MDQSAIHLEYHDATIALLQQISNISHAMLGVFTVSVILIIWAILKR